MKKAGGISRFTRTFLHKKLTTVLRLVKQNFQQSIRTYFPALGQLPITRLIRS